VWIENKNLAGAARGREYGVVGAQHAATAQLEDRALRHMARVIHAADLPQDEPATPLAPGVLAIFDGIRDSDITDDVRMARGFVVCDALYQYCMQDACDVEDE